MDELNSQFRSVNSPLSKNNLVSGYDFDINNERDAVNSMHIKSFSFSQGTSGTLTLGGTNNGNGLVKVKSESGSQLVQLDKVGITISGNQSIVLGLNSPLGWGTSRDDTPMIMGFNGTGNGGTFNLEHNASHWDHYIEDATYLVKAVDGTIIFNLRPVSGTSLIRIKNNTTTIAEIDSNGNMKLAGTLGTGISF